jgi:formylmethanofuran dehydrogenase subunit D
MPNLSNEKFNQVSTEKKLAVVSEAQNYINAFNQRNLQSLLTKPKVHKKESTGSVFVNIKIDATTLNNAGLLFLAQGHPEYLAPKVANAIVQDSTWSTPAYQNSISKHIYNLDFA